VQASEAARALRAAAAALRLADADARAFLDALRPLCHAARLLAAPEAVKLRYNAPLLFDVSFPGVPPPAAAASAPDRLPPHLVPVGPSPPPHHLASPLATPAALGAEALRALLLRRRATHFEALLSAQLAEEAGALASRAEGGALAELEEVLQAALRRRAAAGEGARAALGAGGAAWLRAAESLFTDALVAAAGGERWPPARDELRVLPRLLPMLRHAARARRAAAALRAAAAALASSRCPVGLRQLGPAGALTCAWEVAPQTTALRLPPITVTLRGLELRLEGLRGCAAAAGGAEAAAAGGTTPIARLPLWLADALALRALEALAARAGDGGGAWEGRRAVALRGGARVLAEAGAEGAIAWRVERRGAEVPLASLPGESVWDGLASLL